MYTSSPSTWTWKFLIGMAICFLVGAALVAKFAEGGALVAYIWAFVAAILGGIGGFGLWKQKDTADLLSTGVRSTATVLGVKNTGVLINNVPRFMIRLRVDRPGAPFEAAIGALTYSPASIGSVMDVCYDPKNVKHIAFVDDDASASLASSSPSDPSATDPSNIVESLAQLEKMHQSGSLSDDEFARAKREVLGGP